MMMMKKRASTSRLNSRAGTVRRPSARLRDFGKMEINCSTLQLSWQLLLITAILDIRLRLLALEEIRSGWGTRADGAEIQNPRRLVEHIWRERERERELR